MSALQSATTRTFASRRAAVVRRQEIVARNPELQEREFSKQAALAGAITAELIARRVEPRTASLIAATGTLLLSTAMQDWVQSDGEQHLQDLLRSALQTLRTTIGAS